MKKIILAISLLLIITVLSIPTTALENLAYQISESTASTYFSDSYLPSNVYDGYIWEQEMRLPSWITDFESEADLTLTWNTSVTITKAMLYDLPSAEDNVLKGSITFSEGTKVDFGVLNPDGTATEISLPSAITIDSVVIHIISDEITMSVGLDEVEFFDANGKNVALDAKAEASSVQPDGDPYWFIPESYTDWYVAYKAINGVVSVKRPASAENEWASLAEPLPWIALKWSAPVKIGTIVIHDRVGDSDWITAGDITFADGTVISFEALDNNGAPLFIDIPDISTNIFTINVTTSEGPNPGFAEIEVYTEHFNADGTPIASEVSAPLVSDQYSEAAVPVIGAPATFDNSIILIVLLSISAGVLVINKKLKLSK